MADETTTTTQDAGATTDTTTEATETKGTGSETVKVEAKAEETKTAGTETKTETKVEVKPESEKKPEPEKFELKLPQGSLLDAGAIERTVAFAKEQGLPSKVAQALLDRESKLLAVHAEGQQKTYKELTTKWVEDIKADKEIGGEDFGKHAELAKRVVDRFGSDDLRKGLNDTGFGNHPELVRMLVKIGKSMSEDQLVLPGKTAATGKDMADVFYGSTTKKE